MAKSLAEAGKHIEVEPEVVAEAVEWLMQQQAVDGSFPEVGTVVNRAMQGGAAFGSALTAYVIMALLSTQVLLHFTSTVTGVVVIVFFPRLKETKTKS